MYGTTGRWPVAERIRCLFSEKGLLQTGIYREANNLAKTIDDLVLQDKVDVFRSQGVVRLIRGLCGIELALRPVTSAANLDCANWQAAAELEPPMDSPAEVHLKAARVEVSKRQTKRARLKRLLKKWGKPHGAYFELMTRDIDYDEEDLQLVCRELKIDY
jgi:hypothetical protein